MNYTRTLLLTLTAAALVAPPAAAHDYWLMPEKFTPVAGEPLKVHLYYGDDFKPENERPFQKDRTPSFVLISATEARELSATTPDQQLPLAELTFAEAGTHLLALDRTAQNINLEPKQFNEYLRHEGLTDILAVRKKTKKLQTQGRERYSRNIKALVQTGDVRNDEIALRTLGKPIEIVPEQNPVNLQPGQNLGVRVLFEGKPLANRQIDALNTTSGKLVRLSARTDKEGRAGFRLDRPGPWIVRLVHMRACARDCRNVDWESFWSSLTFALADAPAQSARP
ncbi:DUF4198 domain-containing protein [Gloeobacter violaceus]|nr:DUF4198 domain-containing protein [Gloeobacter violaceus]